jgi:hypothetical protein
MPNIFDKNPPLTSEEEKLRRDQGIAFWRRLAEAAETRGDVKAAEIFRGRLAWREGRTTC